MWLLSFNIIHFTLVQTFTKLIIVGKFRRKKMPLTIHSLGTSLMTEFQLVQSIQSLVFLLPLARKIKYFIKLT